MKGPVSPTFRVRFRTGLRQAAAWGLVSAARGAWSTNSTSNPTTEPERVSLLYAGAEPPEQTRVIAVTDMSQVGEARRAVASLGAELLLDEQAAGRVALVVTELATNVARHGGGGKLLVRAFAER